MRPAEQPAPPAATAPPRHGWTAGPWFVFGNGHCVGGPLTASCLPDPSDGLPATAGVAMCSMRLRGPEECEANARLIAAAPEMYEALAAMADAYCYAEQHLAAGMGAAQLLARQQEAAYLCGLAMGKAHRRQAPEGGR